MKFRITKNHVDAFCVLIGVLGMGSCLLYTSPSPRDS